MALPKAQREGPGPVSYEVLNASIPLGVAKARNNLSKFNFFHQFISYSSSYPKEYILEACTRSEKYRETSIRNRGAYLLCLLSGERNISDAMSILGCRDEDTKAILIIDNGHHDELETMGITFSNMEQSGDMPDLYSSMALVEMELIH